MINDRQEKILQTLQKKSFASADELAVELGVSGITIRRDFAHLESEKRLSRVHGGAVPLQDAIFGYHLSRRQQINQDVKKAIAALAASLVKPGDTIFLDAGSTCALIAQAFPDDFRLTVITHSLEAAAILKNKRGIRIICPGGELDEGLGAFIGPLTEEALSRMTADKAFVGTAAINLAKGCVNNNIIEWKIKTIFHQQAKTPFIVADSEKFEKTGFYCILPTADMKTVLTDAALPLEIKTEYEKRGIQVLQTPSLYWS